MKFAKLCLCCAALAPLAVTAQVADPCAASPFGTRFAIAAQYEIYAATAQSNQLAYGGYSGPGGNNGDYFINFGDLNTVVQTNNLDFAVAAVDLEGDGRAELVAAYPRSGGGTALFAVDPEFSGGFDDPPDADKDRWNSGLNRTNVALAGGNIFRSADRRRAVALASLRDGVPRVDLFKDPTGEGDRIYFGADGIVEGQWENATALGRTALAENRRNLDVAVGDLDGDGFDDEIAMSYVTDDGGQRLVVLAADGPLTALAVIDVSGGTPSALAVAVGDIDGDGRDEIVLMTDNAPPGGNSSGLRIRIYDAPPASNEPTNCLPRVSGNLCVVQKVDFSIAASTQTSDMTVADSDGDRRAEIIVGYGTSTSIHVDTLDYISGSSLSFHNRFSSNASGFGNVRNMHIEAGDLEKQGKAQIILAFRGATALDAVRIEDRATAGAGMIYHATTADVDGNTPKLIPFLQTSALRPRIAIGDYNNDAITADLQALPGTAGNCRVVRENQVKSFVFMPPTWSRFTQGRAGWMGNATSMIDDSERSVTSFNSHSISGYVGAGFDAGVASASVKATASVEYGNSTTAATGLINGKSSSLTWWGGQNFVVLESTRYACFTYQFKVAGNNIDGRSRVCELQDTSELAPNAFAWESNPDYRSAAGANLRWIAPQRAWANQTLINQAQAVQSSTALPSTGADRAINNVISPTDFSETLSETRPWLMIDLGATQLVGTVRIVNRAGNRGSALNNFSVFVGNQDFRNIANDPDIIAANPSVTYSSLRNGQALEAATFTTWNANVPVIGRYVKVMLDGTPRALTLAEIQVFGPDSVDPDRHPLNVTDLVVGDGKFEVILHDPATGNVRSVDVQGTLLWNGVAENTLNNSTVSAGGVNLVYELDSITGASSRQSIAASNTAAVGIQIDAEAGLLATVQFGGGVEFSSGVTTEQARTVSVQNTFNVGGSVGGTPNDAPSACNYQIRPFYYTTSQVSDAGYEHEYLVVDYAIPGAALDRTADLSACKNALVPPATGALIAHWPFDGNAQDISGNFHDGTVEGAATFGPGVLGQALDLRGGQGWVDIVTPVLSQLPACSISLWMNIASFEPGDPEQSCCNGVLMEDGFRLNTVHANLAVIENPPVLAFVSGGLTGAQGRALVPPTNVWAHYVYTYDASNGSYQIFRDGTLSSAGIHDTFPANGPFPACGNGDGSTIGAWDTSGNGDMTRFFDGLIDDVRIYGRILSQGEAASLMDGADPFGGQGSGVFCASFEPGEDGRCD